MKRLNHVQRIKLVPLGFVAKMEVAEKHAFPTLVAISRFLICAQMPHINVSIRKRPAHCIKLLQFVQETVKNMCK